jgi:hypothetical protein
MKKMVEFENAVDVPAGFFQNLPQGVTLLQQVDPECAVVETDEAGIAELQKTPNIIVRDQAMLGIDDDVYSEDFNQF